MKDNQENAIVAQEKERKTLGEIISKILTVICAIAAIALVGVTVFALISANQNKTPDTGSASPDIITSSTTTTAPSTTLASAEGVKIKGKVYAKADADILAEPSTEATVVAKLKLADTIDFVSVDESGWCTVVYDGKICYVHREYLSTKKPETDTTVSEGDTSASEGASNEGTTESTQSGERKVVNLNQKHWSVVVVDKNRQMPEGFEPELAFVADSDYALDKRAATYYDEMYKAALADNVELTPYSGYRSYSTQETNYQSLVDAYLSQGYSQEDAENMAATEILPAGCSEHNLGLAMDICGTEDSFKDTQQYKWLCENAYKYGFIERYPEGKQDVTGVIPEPWHWRFIGPKYAEDMKSRGAQTLEEYLQSYNFKY